MTPVEAGNWMDEIRSNQQYKYTAPWHFVNIEPGGTYQPAPNGDIITALNKAYTELQHLEKLTPEQLRFDVRMLFHLCGDLMHPLHVGYGSDKGGNTYQVQYNGRGTNLHSIWDTRIIESQGNSQKLQKVDFMAWLNESRALLTPVYVEGHKLDDAYMQNNKAVVITQLKDGAALLATCLEQVLSRVENVPVIPQGQSIGPILPGPRMPAKNNNITSIGKVTTTTGTIAPDQAVAHIGEQVTICGKVYSTKALNNGPTFINMGGEYPDNPVTAVIIFDKRGGFSYKPEEYLKGKNICVTGTVKNYKGKPEIVVEKEEQVKMQ